MTYGSNEWHRQQGRAIIDHEMKMAAAESNRKRDKEAVAELVEGEKAIAHTDSGEFVGILLEILDDDRVVVENWEDSVTVPARRVEQE